MQATAGQNYLIAGPPGGRTPNLCNSLKLPSVTEALLHHTAVDAHDLARDVAGRVHSEEGDGTCDLRGEDGGVARRAVG